MTSTSTTTNHTAIPVPSVSSTSPPASAPEPGGPGQSLAAAGTLAICAASFSPDPLWLRNFLARTLNRTSGLRLHDGARTALIEQALEIAQSTNPSYVASTALNGYLSAAVFSPQCATTLISSLLYADVISSTAYDARSREALMRFATALRLPPRIVLVAEATLAALVRSVEENARLPDGANVEAVAEDDEHSRRRRSLKWLKVGAAGVVGGLALGLSGGLIAPALLPALSTVGLASVSAPLAALGGGGAVAVGGLFGAAGAGVGAAAMASRTGVVDEFRFEPFVKGGESRESRYQSIRITPSSKVYDVQIPGRAPGGLLVWEILTMQEYAIVVPGLISFSVGFRSGDDERIDWLLPEEEMEVGGLDRLGEGRRRRTTGAITVHSPGTFVLRFRLLPGSLPVNLSYRVALVPPGQDPPLWIMDDNEEKPQELVTGDVRSLSMAIFVPGLVTNGENGTYPGMCADQFAESASGLAAFDVQCFALRWDSELLLELSDALRKLIGRMALSVAARSGAMMIAPALIGAVALPVSVIAALRSILGNTWAKTLSHAAEAGYMLAAELASRSFGNRPVSLAGYSAGALVIFSCLRELARRELVGIVHDVCIMGAPCSADITIWREIRTVVGGRLINVFNPHDWYLEVYHRGTNLGAVAGTRSIQDPDGVIEIENVCLERDEVATHFDYAKQCAEILKGVGFGDAEVRRPWDEIEKYEVAEKNEDKANDDTTETTESWDGEMGSDSVGDTDGEDEVTLFKGPGGRKKTEPVQPNKH